MKEKIYYLDSKGNKICGILSNPKTESNVPIIILCHGFTSSKNSPTNRGFEQIFNNKNIATFRFDFFGHGESEGDFENITISETVEEILNAIDYVKEKGFTKIGLIGTSFGGMSSIMAASKTNDLSVLALRSPVSNYLERDAICRTKDQLNSWKSKGFIIHTNSKGEKKKLNYTYFEDFKNNNGYEAAKKIKIPTLITHGDNDKCVLVEQSKKVISSFEQGKLEIFKDCNHYYSKPSDFEKMLKLISEFVIKHV